MENEWRFIYFNCNGYIWIYTIDWIYFDGVMKSGCLCLCGCGEETNLNWRTHIPNRFLAGHSNRVEHPFKDKHHKPETKEYFRELYKGKHFSPETEIKPGQILNPEGLGGWTGKTLSVDVIYKPQGYVIGLKQ